MRMVGPEEFWQYMCKPSFVRLSKLQGMCRAELIVTTQAPEDVDGLIESAIVCVAENLRTDLLVGRGFVDYLKRKLGLQLVA